MIVGVPMAISKICIKCSKRKPLSRFKKDKRSTSGCLNICNKCNNIIEYIRLTNPNARQKKRANGRKYYHSHKEHHKRYVNDNKDFVIKYKKRHYKENKQKYVDKAVQWQMKNRERYSLLRRVVALNRRAAKRGLTKISFNDIVQQFIDQDGCCFYCQMPLTLSFHVDHKTPFRRGGLNTIDNICCACRHCNVEKNTLTADEYIAERNRCLK